MTEFNAWVFQGNPNFYDLEKYIQSSRQIYWNTPARNRTKIAIGDPVIIWRSTIDRGAIAVGYVNELPTKAAEVLHPEALGREFWVEQEIVNEEEWKTGIQLVDIRLGSSQGMVTQEHFKQHPLLQRSQIIKNPRGTVFQMSQTEFQAFEELWKSSSMLSASSSVGESCAKYKNSIRKRSFWWVSHGSSFSRELDGGYIWCPVVRDEDVQRPTWINVSKVRKGDLVVSYAKGLVRAVGVAITDCFEAPVPEGHGSWNGTGWQVDIDWVFLDDQLRPMEHMAQLGDLLPARNSPLRPSGEANQFYLCEVSKQFFDVLTGLAGQLDVRFESKLDDAEIDVSSASETEASYLRKARIGQGKFREGVMSVRNFCCVTGTVDPRLLIASHIKPWRESAKDERLDKHNGFMLAPHVDRLFDKGLISFSDDGDILVSNKGIEDVLKSWGISPDHRCPPFHRKNLPYLAQHRALFGFVDLDS